jgi:uncharacterized RDD family membrane protein YckC
MNAPNPYAPPKTPVADPVDAQSGPNVLATRGRRAMAASVDSLVALFLSVPLIFHFKFVERLFQGEDIPLGIELEFEVLGFALFMLVNAYFLAKNGQTLGKKLLGIRIATLDGGIPELWRTIVLRYASVSFATMLPYVGYVVYVLDPIFIYRRDHRCIHDLIAGTQVLRIVQPTPRPA